MQLDLYVFDWSGVISDDRLPVYESNMRLFDHFGIQRISFEEWRKRSTLSAVGILRNHGVTKEMASDGVIKEMYKENLDAVIKSGTTPKVYPDAKEILELLKNKNKIVSVLSSHPEQNLLREIEEYELKIYLDLILGDRGENKVEGLKRTFMKFNKKSGDVLYTGDTVYDIQAAKKAETFSAGICNGYHLREALENESPDFLFENLTEIKKLEIL